MFRFKTWTAAAAVGAALAGSLLTVEPAYAQSTYEGRVTANGGLLVRHLPTAASAVEGKLSEDSRSGSSAKCGEAVSTATICGTRCRQR
jgi:hypothetical protein